MVSDDGVGLPRALLSIVRNATPASRAAQGRPAREGAASGSICVAMTSMPWQHNCNSGKTLKEAESINRSVRMGEMAMKDVAANASAVVKIAYANAARAAVAARARNAVATPVMHLPCVRSVQPRIAPR